MTLGMLQHHLTYVIYLRIHPLFTLTIHGLLPLTIFTLNLHDSKCKIMPFQESVLNYGMRYHYPKKLSKIKRIQRILLSVLKEEDSFPDIHKIISTVKFSVDKSL